MGCKYEYNGQRFETYESLVSALSDAELGTVADLLFSLGNKQDIIYDHIQNLKKEMALNSSEVEMIDGSPDLAHNKDTFTTQTFIDSQYFRIGEETPMFRLNTKDYIEVMKKRFLDSHEMTEEQAEAWGDMVQKRWDDIAQNATDFHKLIMSPTTDSLYEWGQRTVGTAFSTISEQIKDAEKRIFRQVMLRNGQDHRGNGKAGKVIKNVNLEADLRDLAEKIIGHIDYVVIRDNGDIELFNVKTSIEPFSQWATAKKEKYRYQLALLKRMLAFHGIDARHIRSNIIPVQLKYNEQFDTITEIRVQDAVSFDTSDGQFFFQKYDNVAAQFIDSSADFSTIDNSSLLTASKHLQHIFPGVNIEAQGMKQTAVDWVAQNWKYCRPEALPNGGYRLTLPDSKEVVEVADGRQGAKNEEFIAYITDYLQRTTTPFAGETSSYFLRTDIENSFRVGFFTSNMKGKSLSYVEEQFSKYFQHKVNPDGSFAYDWDLVSSPVLTAANIIAFRHKQTDQLDVFTISGLNPGTKHSFKGRTNLLGAHLQDMNSKGFTMEATFGNMEAIRTLAILNQALPDIGNVKLGQLRVLGLNSFHTKKGAFFEFDSLLPQWDTVVQVVNANTPAGIVNNFRTQNIQCIAPEEILRQAWVEIIQESNISDLTEIKGLEDIIDQRIKSDGTRIDGLMNMATIEGKIEKLELLIDRLRELADAHGLNYQSTQALIEARGGDRTQQTSSTRAAIAKLYILASQALSKYYGDIALNNEEFSSFQEYAMKTTSINNSSVRRVGYLVQKSIDNIRAGILDEYMPNAMQIFKQYYDDCGYGAVQNSLIGNQASLFNNLYKPAENGENTFEFKNPYDMSEDLKPHERTFLKNILYEFYKVRCAMRHISPEFTSASDPKLSTEMPANYLYVPLQASSKATKRLHLKEHLVAFGRKVHRLINKPTEVFEEMSGYLSADDVRDRDLAIDQMRVYNRYTRSELSTDQRSKYIAEKGEGFFETNLENIFIDFLSEQVRVDEFNKLLIRIKGIELALTLKGLAENSKGDDQEIQHTIKTIDDYVTLNVFNKSIMEKTSRKIDAFLNPLRRLVSSFYIAANPVAAIRDTLQGLQENFLQAAIKYQTDINAKDVAFGYAQVFQEGVTNMMAMSKLNQFNIKYGFSNFDAANVAERLKSGRGGVLNAENWAYWTLRAPDYLNRMTLFAAKLHHDGAWDAYSLDEEHRLVYNWRKDKRFDVYATGDTTNPKYHEQKALYYSLIREFNMDTGSNLAYTDDLPDAYTPSQIRAIKTLGESIYGAYDQSSKAKYENIAIGRNFMFFSTWMNGIVDNYFKQRQISQSELALEQETDYNGNPLFFTGDESGNVTTEDTGLPVVKHVPIMVQGIFQTFGQYFKELKGNEWDFKKTTTDVFSNEVNRRNLKRALTDLFVALLLSWLFKQFITPAYREHKANDDGRDIITNITAEWLYKSAYTSFDTFKGPYAVLTYLGDSTNPATYKLQSKLLNDAFNVVVGEKTMGQTVMSSQAFFRSMQDSYKMYMRDTSPQE